MAWAEKLPSGKYRGVYRDGAGKRRSAGTFTHKAKAVREAGAKESEARKKKWCDPEAYKLPWGEWREEWMKARKVEATTARADAIRIKKHLDPRWSAIPVGSITRHDVKVWARELSHDVGPGTVQRIVHLLSASLNAAMDAEVIESNPAARIALPKSAIEQERYLTHDEFDAVLEQMPTGGDRLIVSMLANTGLRWSELAGLHWARVDLRRGLVRVVETYNETEGAMKAYPKGKRAREVPLTDDLVAALSQVERSKGSSCGVDHSTGICRGPLVFTTGQGRPLRNSNWSPLWRTAIEESGVDHARIHDLRHTYASWLLQQGIPLAEVGKLMGHISTQTTAKYAHLAESPTEAVRLALLARGADRGTASHPTGPSETR